MLDAAKAMKLSAKDLLNLNIIDEIIPEPLGGAHRDRDMILENIKSSISQNLDFFKTLTAEEILNHRKDKFLKIGRGKGFVSSTESLSAIQTSGINFREIIKSKKNITIFATAVVIIALFALIIF
jgi:acetyl-CoA carboxylase carboxyl transferase subunit alpha